jgi:poly-gamma-glutamate capsule biosynthesis protein CapA/YwtB (metallophosphatase superfamily)
MERYYRGNGLMTALLLILTGLSHICYGQSGTEQKLSLLFMGDIMGHKELIWSAENREKHTYNYDTVFAYVRSVISEADIAIANFEVTMAGPPYSGYPAFSSPAALAVAAKKAGIDCMVTANNHIADRRSSGIIKTNQILDSLGILHTGTFLNPEQRENLYPLIIEKNGFSIALLNYTYGTNGIRVQQPVIVNSIDREIILKDLAKAESQNPDITIVFLHWGKEYDTIPSAEQDKFAGFLFENGADLVIGSHPHVIQRMVWTKNCPGRKGNVAVYSLGNFISNQQKLKTKGGAIARIEITRVGSTVQISDVEYYLTWVYTPIEKYRKRFFIIPCSEFENKADFFSDPEQYKLMKKFIRDSRSLLYKQNKNIYEFIYNGSSWLLNF